MPDGKSESRRRWVEQRQREWRERQAERAKAPAAQRLAPASRVPGQPPATTVAAQEVSHNDHLGPCPACWREMQQ
jgi:hypothetical protein